MSEFLTVLFNILFNVKDGFNLSIIWYEKSPGRILINNLFKCNKIFEKKLSPKINGIGTGIPTDLVIVKL